MLRYSFVRLTFLPDWYLSMPVWAISRCVTAEESLRKGWLDGRRLNILFVGDIDIAGGEPGEHGCAASHSWLDSSSTTTHITAPTVRREVRIFCSSLRLHPHYTIFIISHTIFVVPFVIFVSPTRRCVANNENDVPCSDFHSRRVITANIDLFTVLNETEGNPAQVFSSQDLARSPLPTASPLSSMSGDILRSGSQTSGPLKPPSIDKKSLHLSHLPERQVTKASMYPRTPGSVDPNNPPWPAFRGYHTYSFANATMGVRLPTILSKAIQDVLMTVNTLSAESLIVDLLACVKRMEELKADLEGNGVLRYIKDDGEADVALWNKEIAKYFLGTSIQCAYILFDRADRRLLFRRQGFYECYLAVR